MRVNATMALKDPLVNFGDFTYDCVVGTRFWHDRTVTLDLPSRRLIVVRKTAEAGKKG